MAAAPREGQAWFLKSSLKSPGYDGSKQEDFFRWMLLEVVYNNSEDEGGDATGIPPLHYPGHPRTGQQQFYGGTFTTCYGRYEFMSVMYGPSAEDIKRTYRVKSGISRDQLHRQTGTAAICYVAVPLPTAEEKFIWIDLTYPVRAFYIPCSHMANTQHKEHAIFSRLVVRGRKGMPTAYRIKGQFQKAVDDKKKAIDKFYNDYSNHNFKWRRRNNVLVRDYNNMVSRMKEAGPEGKAEPEPGLNPDYRKPDGKVPSQEYAIVTFDRTADESYGWGLMPDWTVRVDTFTLACQLLVPYANRTDEYKDVYKCLTLFGRRAVHQSATIGDFDMAQAIDLARALSAEEGTRLSYEKDEPDSKFVKELLAGFIAVGLGFIPGIGPLVAFGWSVMFEVLTDTDKFTKAAGIGGKAPAATQAVVDARAVFKPMIKAIGKGLFKSGMEQGDKPSVHVDVGEGEVKDASESQQQSGSNEKKENVDTQSTQNGSVSTQPQRQAQVLQSHESQDEGLSEQQPDGREPDNELLDEEKRSDEQPGVAQEGSEESPLQSDVQDNIEEPTAGNNEKREPSIQQSENGNDENNLTIEGDNNNEQETDSGGTEETSQPPSGIGSPDDQGPPRLSNEDKTVEEEGVGNSEESKSVAGGEEKGGVEIQPEEGENGVEKAQNELSGTSEKNDDQISAGDGENTSNTSGEERKEEEDEKVEEAEGETEIQHEIGTNEGSKVPQNEDGDQENPTGMEVTGEGDINDDSKGAGEDEKNEGDVEDPREYGEGEKTDIIKEDTKDLSGDVSQENDSKDPEEVVSEDEKGPMVDEDVNEGSKDGDNEHEKKSNDIENNGSTDADNKDDGKDPQNNSEVENGDETVNDGRVADSRPEDKEEIGDDFWSYFIIEAGEADVL